MNSKITDQFVPLAERAAAEAGIIRNNTVSSEMRGYVSGFCVNVRDSLTMTVLSFNKDEKKKVPDAVNRMLKAAREAESANAGNGAGQDRGETFFPGILDLDIRNSLFETVKNNQTRKNLLREYCSCCGVAIKLLLQMYTE